MFASALSTEPLSTEPLSIKPLANSSRNVSAAPPSVRTPWARLGRLIVLCGLTQTVGRVDAVAPSGRYLRSSPDLPQDGRSYCNTLQGPTGAQDKDCIYLYRTPNREWAHDSGAECTTTAESYREVGVLDYDAGDRPLFRSLLLPPEDNHSPDIGHVPMGGVLPDGRLSTNMRQDYCEAVCLDEDQARQQAKLDGAGVLPESTAYKVCTQGKDFFLVQSVFAGKYARTGGAMVEDRHGTRAIFALPGERKTDHETEDYETSDDAYYGDYYDAYCSSVAFAEPVLGVLKGGKLVASAILHEPDKEYVLDANGSVRLDKFCRGYVKQDAVTNGTDLAPKADMRSDYSGSPSIDNDDIERQETDEMCQIELERLVTIEQVLEDIVKILGYTIGVVYAMLVLVLVLECCCEGCGRTNGSKSMRSDNQRDSGRTPLMKSGLPGSYTSYGTG